MSREKRLILLSLFTGVALMLVKFMAYFITESNAIFSDAAESIVNVVASSFAFYSIYLSAQPKDENHPYGHGKVEFFSIFVEGGLIFIAGSIILVKAFYALIAPGPITNIMEGLWLILSTAVVNFGIGEYLKRRGVALRSLTIEADGKHLQIDAISSIGLIAGLYLMKVTQMAWIDTALSAGLGSYILWSGYKMLRKSISGLMDESDVAVMQEVVDVLGKTRKEDWIDVHNMRIQRYGRELHVDCHLTIPKYYTLTKVHDVISDFEENLNNGLGMPTELFVHADPCMPQCCHYCNVKDCPIRSEEYTKHIEWTSVNLPKNMKHFREC
ncbi:cation diffusion facilitator family transporter [Sphingobacterium corticibacter]|uniref:Cation diffusion facilitator family transporter n=1 Tax=Sphingobacterium corticibacter TaxID=2171749 RepID=A0A2T8HHV6_9SPHI|nr:cation diffusion facilitator family transporter [Sphingobacterium corticibacter]PVH25026.1 cation diffusion facilitator family transporter [Sphingobacterium corticibacter]